MNIILETHNLGGLLDQRRTSDERNVLSNTVLYSICMVSDNFSGKSNSKTYEPVISPNLEASIDDFSSGASSVSASFIASSWKCVIPQSNMLAMQY
jgi:hypothetical protein